MNNKCSYEGILIFQQPSCNYSENCIYKQENRGITWELEPIGPTCKREENSVPILRIQPKSKLEKILRIVN